MKRVIVNWMLDIHSIFQTRHKMEEYKKVYEVLDKYLKECDGTDLIPNHVRVENMLERLSGTSDVFSTVLNDTQLDALGSP